MFMNLFATQVNYAFNLPTSFDLLFVLQSFFRLMLVNEKISIESYPNDSSFMETAL